MAYLTATFNYLVTNYMAYLTANFNYLINNYITYLTVAFNYLITNYMAYLTAFTFILPDGFQTYEKNSFLHTQEAYHAWVLCFPFQPLRVYASGR